MPGLINYLTGLLNRKFLTDNLQAIVNTADSERPVSFVMIDIDNFKIINDEDGHLIGDDVLKMVCTEMRQVVGDRGFPIRYGGDELSIVLANVDNAKAKLLAESIRTKIAIRKFESRGRRVPITVSLGVATIREKVLYTDLVQRADDMLRASKKSGKNRVTEWAA